MGFLDFLLTRQQKKAKVAMRIGLESGLFERCPVCHGVTESRTPEAHRRQTAELARRLTSGNAPDAALFDGNEKALLETVEEVAKSLPFHCTCHDN